MYVQSIVKGNRVGQRVGSRIRKLSSGAIEGKGRLRGLKHTKSRGKVKTVFCHR